MSYTSDALGMTIMEHGDPADLDTVSDALARIDAYAAALNEERANLAALLGTLGIDAEGEPLQDAEAARGVLGAASQEDLETLQDSVGMDLKIISSEPNIGAYSASMRLLKIGRYVIASGSCVASSTIAASVTLFTVPVGWRPSSLINVPGCVMTASALAGGYIRVGADGAVSQAATNDMKFMSFCGLWEAVG